MSRWVQSQLARGEPVRWDIEDKNVHAVGMLICVISFAHGVDLPASVATQQADIEEWHALQLRRSHLRRADVQRVLRETRAAMGVGSLEHNEYDPTADRDNDGVVDWLEAKLRQQDAMECIHFQR
jgi:hypothetical protein